MEKAVSAAAANRQFSQLLREVRRGSSYLVTSHGRPVARIHPVDDAAQNESGAHQFLLSRLRQQPESDIGRWTRDELYEDER